MYYPKRFEIGSFDDLKEINEKISDAEMNHDTAFFELLMSDDLVFRRSNGRFTGKTQFIQDLPNTSYDLLEATEHRLIPFNPDTAYTISRVIAKGKRPDGSEFGGTNINVRFFRRSVNGWMLYAWHNTIATGEDKKQEKNFTGTVTALTILEQPGKKDYEVFFHPGARTYWHIHSEVQKLFIISGTAFVVMKIDGNDKHNTLSAGENIAITPGIMHWHGASPDTFMIHVASNSYNDLPNTYWFNEVTHEECNPPKMSRTYHRSRLTI